MTTFERYCIQKTIEWLSPDGLHPLSDEFGNKHAHLIDKIKDVLEIAGELTDWNSAYANFMDSDFHERYGNLGLLVYYRINKRFDVQPVNLGPEDIKDILDKFPDQTEESIYGSLYDGYDDRPENFKKDCFNAVITQFSQDGLDPRSDEFGEKYSELIGKVEVALEIFKDSQMAYRWFFEKRFMPVFGDIGILVYFRLNGNFGLLTEVVKFDTKELLEKYPYKSEEDIMAVLEGTD